MANGAREAQRCAITANHNAQKFRKIPPTHAMQRANAARRGGRGPRRMRIERVAAPPRSTRAARRAASQRLEHAPSDAHPVAAEPAPPWDAARTRPRQRAALGARSNSVSRETVTSLPAPDAQLYRRPSPSGAPRFRFVLPPALTAPPPVFSRPPLRHTSIILAPSHQTATSTTPPSSCSHPLSPITLANSPPFSPPNPRQPRVPSTPLPPSSPHPPATISPTLEGRAAKAKARRQSVSRSLRRTIDILSPLNAINRSNPRTNFLTPFRSPSAPMRPGIVRERRERFEDMTDPRPAYSRRRNQQPVAAPSLDAIPSHLPPPSHLPHIPYQVFISTASIASAGTDRHVYIQFVGDLACTDFVLLHHESRTVQASAMHYEDLDAFDPNSAQLEFPMGSTREFRFSANDVGNVVKIALLHDRDHHPSSAWRPERIVVVNDKLHRSWNFLCPQWLSRDAGNFVELRPTGDVSAGRRASRRASRRLSSARLARPHSLGHSPVPRQSFEDVRDRFGGSSSPRDAVSSGNEAGTRRVCFQLQKYTQTSSHVYLLGSTPALGNWRPEQALRMTQYAGADGSWRGEWRLELEIDDDYDEITYTYIIISETDSPDVRRADTPDQVRVLRLSASDMQDRPAEGGRIYVRDMFGSNTFGLPSTATPTSLKRRPLSLQELIKTPLGSAKLMSGLLRPPQTPQPRREKVSDDDGIQKNLDGVLGSSSEDRTNDVASVATDAATQGSFEIAAPANGQSESAAETAHAQTNGLVQVISQTAPVATGSPREDLARSDEASRREWKQQLDASDDQLLRSTEDLKRRQSEVLYLKKRNSRDLTNSPLTVPQPLQSPERTSPVSSEGLSESEQLSNESGVDDMVPPLPTETSNALVEERDRLASEVNRLELLQKEKDLVHSNATAVLSTLRDQLAQLRDEMASRCEEYETQYAELVRLTMDAREAHAAVQQQLTVEKDDLYTRWRREFKERRKLFNTVQELRGNIRVFCRVRPLKNPMTSDGRDAQLTVDFPDAATGEHAKIKLGSKSFEFDHVFPPLASQGDVYEETAGVVASVLDGYNVCVFAYGQTGSGKTHTMDGPKHDRGVNFRALEDLFELAKQREVHSEVKFSVSIMEIYNESLRDLISSSDALPTPSKLEIRKDPNSSSANAVYVPNLTEVQVDTLESVLEVLGQGMTNRSKGKTNMNEHSSRSHLLLKVTVFCEEFSSGVKTSGRLHLVDLAGSERVARSQASGDRLREAQHINKSLATLGDVFTALTTNSSHIPYRNSKLTYLLQDCLGGDSKTLMFVNVSADEIDSSESLSSLQFAQRVAKVELGNAQKHVERTAEVKAVAALESKESEYQVLQSKFSNLQRELKKKDESVTDLVQKARSLEGELRSAKRSLEERNKREAAGREGSAKELKQVKAQHEKSQTDLRTANQRTKTATDLIASKDEEIRRLQGLLGTKDRSLASLERALASASKRSKSHDDVDNSALSSNRLHRPASTPNVGGRKPERTPQSRLPRSASSFTARSRQVRFDDSVAQSALQGKKTEEGTATGQLPPTPSTAARRVGDAGIPRGQTTQGSRLPRQGSRTGPTGSAGKRVTYAFGSRVESAAPDPGTASKPTRNTRLPRAQTTLMRPAQRVQTSTNKAGNSTQPAAGRSSSAGLRRAGTISGPHRSGTMNGAAK